MKRELCPECDGWGAVKGKQELPDIGIEVKDGFTTVKMDESQYAETIHTPVITCPVCHGRRWISPWRKASEELPPVLSGGYSDWYPVWDAYGNWTKAAYDFENKKWRDPNGFEINVTHWQPIEPPEET
jgi:hypothetical protein